MNSATTPFWQGFSEAGAVSEGNMVAPLPHPDPPFIEVAYGFADLIFYTQ